MLTCYGAERKANVHGSGKTRQTKNGSWRSLVALSLTDATARFHCLTSKLWRKYKTKRHNEQADTIHGTGGLAGDVFAPFSPTVFPLRLHTIRGDLRYRIQVIPAPLPQRTAFHTDWNNHTPMACAIGETKPLSPRCTSLVPISDSRVHH